MKTFAQPEPGTSKWVTKAGHVKYVIDCMREVMSILKDTKIWAPPEQVTEQEWDNVFATDLKS
ncbi:MAG: hypothetical protein V4805_12695, partial [Pseudomonadota bacterium]